MAILIPADPAHATPTGGWPISISGSGAPTPRVWLERIQTPGAHRISADGLYAFRPGSAAGGVLAVAKAPIRGVPILCFFNRPGIPGFLCRLPSGARAGPAFLAETLATHTVTGIVAVPRHAGRRSTSWNRPITIASPAAIRNSPSWRGGAAGWSQTGCFGSILAYTPFHHFCYSLSSIPLYG